MRSRPRKPVTPLWVLGVLALTCSVFAQGRSDYLNFESPPVKPIEVVTVGSVDYLVVCNTPRSRLEIFSMTDSSNPQLTQVASIPTGLEPVSVVVKPSPDPVDGSRYVYTMNWIGDSVTIVKLTPSVGATPFAATLLRTDWVGDEPMHATFARGGSFDEFLLVVFGQSGSWGWFDPFTLQTPSPAWNQIDLKDVSNTSAIQAGRMIAYSPTASTTNLPNWLMVLNQRGGQQAGLFRAPADVALGSQLIPYDNDMWGTDDAYNAQANGGLSPIGPIGGFGTTNFAMAFASNGDLFVVGTEAHNLDMPVNSVPLGLGSAESLHATVNVTNGTGLAASMLYRLRINPVAPGTLPLDAYDLNLFDPGTGVPVPYDRKIAQPTDVVVYERSGMPTRVIVTGFNSDTIAVITPNDSNNLGSWAISRASNEDLANRFGTTMTSTLTGNMRGARGLAIRYSPTNQANDVVFILNSIENSITSLPINPVQANVNAPVALVDPRPAYIRDNRKFLYSSRISGSNTSSCATCHPDGHTDQLDWNISTGFTVDGTFPLPGALTQPFTNPGEKGPMVTQSLRGLVNFEVSDQFWQNFLFSNRPYHWRGDRPFFDDFNGAFVGLLANPPTAATSGLHPLLQQGITPGPGPLTLPAVAAPPHTMAGFREFIGSIHYPPNPEQPRNRRYTGTFFSPGITASNPAAPAEANNPGVGTLAQQGMKLFHIRDYAAGAATVSCVSCHILPDGSDNLQTEQFLNLADATLPPQALETAQMRGMHEKEKRLFRRNAAGGLVPAGPSSVVTGNVGLIHTGSTTVPGSPLGANSIRDFIKGFPQAIPAGSPANLIQTADIDPLTMFFREFDTGVGPAVGLSASGDSMTQIGLFGAINTLETYANDANCGLVAHVRVNGQMYGFYYDVTDTTSAPDATYLEVLPPAGSGITPLGNQTRTQFITMLTAPQPSPPNLLIMTCVPSGSERRLANVHMGSPPPVTAVTPSLAPLALRPMKPATQNELIPMMTLNWQPIIASSSNTATPNRATAVFQQAILTESFFLATTQPYGYSATTPRHDAPRRFRVSGTGIRLGARLRIYLPSGSDIATASMTTPPTTTPSTSANLFLELPIHPSRTATSDVIWETAVEADPALYYAIMNGVTSAPLATAYFTSPSLIPGLDVIAQYIQDVQVGLNLALALVPSLNNWVGVQVLNTLNGGTQSSNIIWERVTLQ